MTCRRVVPVLAAIVGLACGAAAAPHDRESAPDRPHRTVLLLHSYHPGYGWTDDLERGISRAFAASRFDVDVRVEHLDAKHFADAGHTSRMSDFIAAKYATMRFDAILTTDDAALAFVASEHRRLFTSVPVVFCGVNDATAPLRLPRAWFTGIVEVFSDAPLLDLVSRLHRDRPLITVIGDNSDVGGAMLEQFRGLARRDPRRTFRFFDGRAVPLDAILATLRATNEPGVVVTSSLSRDASGRPLRASEWHRRLVEATRDPVYSPSISELGQGIVGGTLSTGEHHGSLAARMAIDVLGGARPDAIPVLEDRENQYVFDRVQLDRWQIASALLPAGSAIVNQPDGFYARYSRAIWGGVALFVVQTCVIAALVASIVRRRRAERRMAAAHAALETEMEERRRAESAREHLAAQLTQAQKVEAVGLLAGGVAHDFNNLLSVILGHTGLAAEALPPDHPARADLAEVERAGDRAAAMTRQLLAFSRRQVLQPVAFDLHAATREMTSMLRRLIGENIALVHDPAPGAAVTWIDPGQVEQVLLNLAVNARDAMPDGGTLTISTATVELDAPGAGRVGAPRPGPYVRLSVRDTGRGMSPEVQARVFEPFFTTKPKGQGTGLGLSTVYGIVKQSRGAISITSREDQGTTVDVFLPRAASDVALATPGRAAPSPIRGRRDETVLVVEDEDAVRALAKRVLEDHGYSVTTAVDGAEAVRFLEARSTPVHLVLSDVVMPKMGGPALVAWLAANRPTTRAILMSGYASDASIPAHVPFVAKPFDAHAMARLVRHVLDDRPPSPVRES